MITISTQKADGGGGGSSNSSVFHPRRPTSCVGRQLQLFYRVASGRLLFQEPNNIQAAVEYLIPSYVIVGVHIFLCLKPTLRKRIKGWFVNALAVLSTMSSPLPTGKYIIRNFIEEDGPYIGRSENEDTSLLPKSVISLPKGVWAPEVSLLF